MGMKFTNFARAKVSSAPVGTGGLSFSVEAGKGALFPALGAGEYFYGCFKNASGTREIVKVEARSTDAFTIASGGRAQDGTVAYASWATNDYFELGWYSKSIQDFSQADQIAYAPSGDLVAATAQDALDELEAEKLALAGGEMTGVLGENKSTDITAGATTDMGTATGNFATVTHDSGTLAITSLGGDAIQAGTEIEMLFSIAGGALSLTHHATNLALITGGNITLEDGDVARWRKTHDSNAEWRMVGFERLDGKALTPPVVPVEVPPGVVMMHAMSTPPTGWLKANGAAISRTTYADLFAAIGVTYGVGDGSTTFNVPDLRGEFMRGLDDGRGVDAARAIGSAQADEFKSHNHGSQINAQGKGTNGASSWWMGAIAVSSVGGTETRPRNIALLACIKY